MEAVKWFTQRTTMLLCIAWGVVIVPFVLAKILQLTGLLGWTDSLYDSSNALAWPFWIVFLVSRAVYGGAWILGSFTPIDWGTKHGFFWFKPEYKSSYREEPSVDKTWEILFIPVAIIFCYVIVELAIRIYTWTIPPFMPPPAPPKS